MSAGAARGNESTGGSRSRFPASSLDLSARRAHKRRQRGQGRLLFRLRLIQLGLGKSELSVGTRGIGARPQGVVDQRVNRLDENLPAVHVCLRCHDRLMPRQSA